PIPWHLVRGWNQPVGPWASRGASCAAVAYDGAREGGVLSATAREGPIKTRCDELTALWGLLPLHAEAYSPALILLAGLATFAGCLGLGLIVLRVLRLRVPAPFKQIVSALLGI